MCEKIAEIKSLIKVMSTQWGKKIVINIYKIEKTTTNRLTSSVRMYKNLNKVHVKPERVTVSIIKILIE